MSTDDRDDVSAWMLNQRKLVRPLWDLGTHLGASEPTVVIIGAPRSGTTWLLEMLERATRARRILEPFLYFSPRQATEHNFGLGWRPYLPEGQEHEAMEAYLRRLLDGAGVTFRQANAVPSYGRVGFAHRLVFARCTIIKMCRGTRLLPWMDKHLSTPATLLMRHPLAVVASQLEHPGWSDDGSHPVVCDTILQKYPDLAAYAVRLETFPEKLAATWAFDYLVPLESWDELKKVQLVTYENLVQAPESTVGAVLRHLQLQGSFQSDWAEVPSATTRDDTNVRSGKSPLSTWRHRLTEEQAGRVLEVVSAFGLDFYDGSLLPEPGKLAHFLDSDSLTFDQS